MTGDGGSMPLCGVTVVWTGSAGSGKRLFSEVEARGAALERLPLIEHGPPADPAAVSSAFSEPERFSWFVFTSPEAVRSAARRLSPGSACAAVGPATAARLVECGFPPDLLAKSHSAVSLAEALIETSPKKPLLFVRGDRALRTLPERLRDAGIGVEEVEVYATREVPPDRAQKISHRIGAVANVVVMGSPSGVDVLRRTVSPAPLSSINDRILWISLGNTTLSALVAAGAPDPLRLPAVRPETLAETIGRHLNL